jgi:nucleoid-associated protein Lsr2
MFEPPEAARAASKYNGRALAMATKVLTQLVDDTDGSEADQTVRFGLDGTQYEIDLSGMNASALRSSLDTWVQHARRVGGRTTRPKASSALDLKAVRAWAASNGIELSSRGRIPASVLEQYRAAGN